ncbi:MAG: K(+)-transporting ATPase subunit C [Capsulimonadaceae bacterium]
MVIKQLIISLRVTFITLIICCGAYPLVVWAISQAVFHYQANGSLVKVNGKVVGSELLGQSFASAAYFQSRPSAAGNGYDPTQSGGTNLGPTSDKLINGVHKPNQTNGQPDPSDFDGVKDLAREYRTTNNLAPNALVPVDAVTRSASGLDPHITPENALLQAPRVAAARGIPSSQVVDLVHKYTIGRDLGFLGEPRVNVLMINLALDKMAPMKK